MSITEVQHAIAVELGTHKFDEDNLSDVNELVSVCAGLVAIESQSNIIRLVHYTTQEYFEKNGESLLPGAQQAIAGSCLTYLLYEDCKSGWFYDDSKDSDDSDDSGNHSTDTTVGISSDRKFRPPWRIPRSVIAILKNSHPFYEYAAQHWATHTRYGMDDGVKKLFLDFARDDHKISLSAEALSMVRYGSWNKVSEPLSAMHVLSYLGNDELISMLLEHGFEADIKDVDNATPLWWAVSKGHKKVVELLLSSKTVDVNNVNLWSEPTALFKAVANGDVEIVKLLIAREDVDLNLRDQHDMTPLAEALYSGHDTIVELLLSRNDVDITAEALATAAESGTAYFAEILLNRADVKRVDQKDLWGKTPLIYAASSGFQEVCKLFLSRREVDVNAKDCTDWTPLMYAAHLGHVAVAELLLSCDGIEVNARGFFGQTPLILAVKHGYPAFIELLLSHGSVDVNMRSSDGSTALMYAADKGHEQTVKLLLSHKGTDVNAKDTTGNIPLYVAVALGHKNVVKLLLAHAEIDLGIEDGKAKDAFAQVEQLVEAAFNRPSMRYARRPYISWERQSQTVRQASLELLRAAIEERSQR